MNARITSHVLDTSTGRPAAGLAVRLERADAPLGAAAVATALTDGDGRVTGWLPDGVAPGRYRLVFDTGAWFLAAGRASLHPQVGIDFEVAAGERHYHIPLLVAPFGYSTYRGS